MTAQTDTSKGGLWQCPMCGAPLVLAENGALCCKNKHSFDRAKEGYWHLMPVQSMRTKAPGDSREMVQARRAFLEAGYYGIFGDALAELLLQYAVPDKKRPLHILDAGCGEGWYDRKILARFAAEKREAELAGFDISKAAVRLAAKAAPQASYAVASSFHQPVADGWADAVLNIFSPMAREEFLRVLRPGGVLIYAVPTARHLFGMKQVLYERPYENKEQEIAYEGFTAFAERTAQAEITVPQEHIEALFGMTPYYWRTPAEGAARLRGLQSLTTEIGFRFLLMRRA